MKSLRKILSYIWGYKIKTAESAVNGKLEVWYRNGKFVLDSAHANYSFGSLHTLFRLIFFDVNPNGKTLNNALILGFGAGSAVSILKEEWGLPVKIVAVEHDPVVLELGREYFHADEYPDTEIIAGDALDYVMNTDSTFDMIIIDLFRDNTVPAKFHEPEFLDRIEKILNPKGIMIFNFITSMQAQRKNYRQVLWYINQQYGYTKELPLLGNNMVLICRKY
jgi:spermidine synthase